ncbi:MAG TPA: hypothetical protein VJR29_10175 [bacterium]|nr:hypothetical protein [bacterium]
MTQCKKIQENLAAELLDGGPDPELQAHLAACPACRAEAESFRRLAESFRQLDGEDPGELFFAAQRKRIREAIAAEKPARRAPAWRPALALAAAVLLLFIGLSRWQERKSPTALWSTALLAFTDGQTSVTGSGILELETLNPEQLEGLAQNMERRILGNQDDVLLEDGADLQDLSGPELDQLIQRLQKKLGEQA